MSRLAIIGVGCTPVGRFQSPPEATEQTQDHEIMAGVIRAAVADAGIDKADVGALLFALERDYIRQRYFCTYMANYLRLPVDGMVMEVVGNGMTAGMAFDAACNEVALGRCRVALAAGMNMETAIPTARHLDLTIRHTGDVDFQTPFGLTPISWYALDAARYMHEFGVDRRTLASVAVKNRRHAALNPIAQYRNPITVEDVMAQKMIVEPLGLYEVPPRSDGAACIVVADADFAASLGRPYVAIRGRGFHHEGAHQLSEIPNDMIAFNAAVRAGNQAFAAAGVTRDDLDLAEIYAPCTITEVLAAEALGLVGRGRGAAATAAGELELGGRLPVTTSGGCLSRGHPPFATGLYGFVELYDQLVGRAGARQVHDARLGLSASELGNYNAALVHILEAVG
ncbi:MAG: thiolase family protein [Reyranellaceae bacterium]